MQNSAKPHKVLIISPGIEDAGMRGLGRVTFSLIDALHELGYTTALLTGAPIKLSSSKDIVKTMGQKRLLSHYLSDGIKSTAFKLNRLKIIRLFTYDSIRLLFGKISYTENVQRISAQHEPVSVRMFGKVDAFVNFGLAYKIFAKLPINLRSWFIFSIAKHAGVDAIITASPYPIKHSKIIGRKIKIVQSLHDIMPLNIVETPPDSIELFGKSFSYAMKNADLVITSSENAKNKLNAIFPEIKAEVIYVPSEPTINPNLTNKNIARLYTKVSGKYFLFMSALEKRKNVKRLIEAFDLINPKIGYKLVLVGSKGYGYEEIETALGDTKESVRNNIFMKGYVSEEEKWTLINNATFIIHPAIDEGLGIPAIESMIAKKPLIATQLNSLQEFVPKNCVVYIKDPYNVAEIADKMIFAINNQKQLSQNTKRNAQKIAKEFSFDSYCNRLESGLKTIGI